MLTGIIFGELNSKIIISKSSQIFNTKQYDFSPNTLKVTVEDETKVLNKIKQPTNKNNNTSEEIYIHHSLTDDIKPSNLNENEKITLPYYTLLNNADCIYPDLMLILAKDHSNDLKFKLYLYDFDPDEDSLSSHKIIKTNIIKLLLKNPYFTTIFKNYDSLILERLCKSGEVT